MRAIHHRCLVAAISAIVATPHIVHAGQLMFTDVTSASGLQATMTCGTTPSRHILEVDGGGIALFDYNNDGHLDVFLANGSTLSDPEAGPGSRLFAGRGDGTFHDVTAPCGITLKRWAMGVAVGDYDNDGFDDLFVTCYGANVLLRNDAGRRFVDVSTATGVSDPRWSTSASFGDLDADGDLDLYVVNYLQFDATRPPSRAGVSFKGVPVMAGPSGLAAQADILYENRGGVFVDITSASGCAAVRPSYGLGVMVFDADADGDQDILVGNDSNANFLFENLGGLRFRDMGQLSGVSCNYDGSNQATMGIALGDVDGNGLPDVFTTNFSSDTNTLHLNLGGGMFEDRTSQFGLAMISQPYLSWGAGFYDFDNDGDEDLFYSSGHVYPEAATHDIDSQYDQPAMLFERSGKRFRRVTTAGAALQKSYRGRATAFGDIDEDGDVDILMTTLNGPVVVLRNDAPAQPSVTIALRAAGGNHRGLGAMIELLVGTRRQSRWLRGGSFQSADPFVAYFGCPDAPAGGVVTARVTWPDGTRSTHQVSTGQTSLIEQGRAAVQSRPLRTR